MPRCEIDLALIQERQWNEGDEQELQHLVLGQG